MSTCTSRSVRPVALLALAATALLFATGCNTIKGIGQDISGAAESTEQAFSGWTEPDVPRPAPNPYTSSEPYSYRR